MSKQFDNVEQLRQWKYAYQLLLSNEGQLLLEDLMDYCSFLDTTITGDGPIDALELARREGRRQVFLYIVKNAKLEVDDLMTAYKRKLNRNG